MNATVNNAAQASKAKPKVKRTAPKMSEERKALYASAKQLRQVYKGSVAAVRSLALNAHNDPELAFEVKEAYILSILYASKKCPAVYAKLTEVVRAYTNKATGEKSYNYGWLADSIRKHKDDLEALVKLQAVKGGKRKAA